MTGMPADLAVRTSISLSPEDRDAINILCGMGFPRRVVLQAYIACDRNTDVTANYLIEHGNDMNQDGGDDEK